MNHAGRLAGLTALVTGGDRGVGKGIALALARAGCGVAVNYQTVPDHAEHTVRELQTLGVEAFAVQADVRISSDVQRMMTTVVDRFHRLHVLVNNAAVQTWKPFLDVTETEWDLVIDTNLKGYFLCAQAAARHMQSAGGGSIVNIGSGCNHVAFPRLVAYTASKGGVEMLTKVSAIELGPYGIRVNCVAPGAIETERTRLERADYAGTWASVTPLGRVGTPEDVGRVVTFLASDDSKFVSGQTLLVDGGLFARSPWPEE